MDRNINVGNREEVVNREFNRVVREYGRGN